MTIFDRLLTHSESQPSKGQQQHEQKPNNFFFCLNIKQYFNIEEEDIINRAKSALLLKPSFRHVINSQPDLYGPFWISTTLIIIIIASSSLITFFNSENQSYNFDKISVAAGLVYGIAFGCPYIIAIVMKFMGSQVSVVQVCVNFDLNQLICIYGYSMVSFLPVTLLCFVGLEIVQIILLAVGYCLSSVFLIRGILSMDRSLGQKEKLVLGAFILGVQFILVLMYKFYFFKLL